MIAQMNESNISPFVKKKLTNIAKTTNQIYINYNDYV